MNNLSRRKKNLLLFPLIVSIVPIIINLNQSIDKKNVFYKTQVPYTEKIYIKTTDEDINEIQEVNPLLFEIGAEAFKDKFPIIMGDEKRLKETNVLGDKDDNSLTYRKHLVELPLYAGDHYYGKHINAAAAASELNTMPILEPGDTINVITDGYLTMHRSKGYIQPPYPGFLYASGVCWSTSTLGTLMDEANKEFSLKYGIPLFVFGAYDRSPHNHSYYTYRDSNYGYGYTVVKHVNGASTDYSFAINPELKKLPKFKNLKLKIVMSASTNHETGYLGHSIEAHIKTNINF